MEKRRIAFFDVDKTLLGVNSGSLWLKSEWRAGRLSPGELIRAGTALIRYSFGATNIEGTMHSAIKGQRGQCAATLRARTSDFLRNKVIGHLRPDGVRRLEAHRARGDLIVLLTTSTQFLAEPLGNHLGVDGVLATTLEIGQDGFLTGETVGPLCYGPGKIHHALGFAKAYGSGLERAVFYSDSFSDLPMLEAVDEPIVVTPDRKLRKVATIRGWPIEEWRNP